MHAYIHTTFMTTFVHALVMATQTAGISFLPHLFALYLVQLPLKYSSSWLLDGLDLSLLGKKSEDKSKAASWVSNKCYRDSDLRISLVSKDSEEFTNHYTFQYSSNSWGKWKLGFADTCNIKLGYQKPHFHPNTTSSKCLHESRHEQWGRKSKWEKS